MPSVNSVQLFQLTTLRRLVLNVKVFDKFGNVIIVLILCTCTRACTAAPLRLDVLVGLSKLSEGGERVRTKLVEDSWDKLGEFLDSASSVDRKCVGSDGGMD